MVKLIFLLFISTNLYGGTIFPEKVGDAIPSSDTMDFINGLWAFQTMDSETPILLLEYRLLDKEDGAFLVINHNGRYYEDDSEGNFSRLRTGPDGLLFFSTLNKDKRPDYQGYIVGKIRISNSKYIELLDDADTKIKEAIRSGEIEGEILRVTNDDRFGGYETPKISKINSKAIKIISGTDVILRGFRIVKNKNNELEPVVPYNSSQSLRD
ncbi:hypothetical protein [Pelagicoccus sp. SDUM812003]|uniref:hypothetical protein n=1 Tax=Pelagicoccus sp. SDUM812003 TaxID=3041267 RepID=UPI00281007C2|nr:hypothetical protein [Pelagicoccus sp. SDUM812003]MDQ8202703.1 hypothetical protein [Pelagicoccus sp. SDUM812003]